MHSPRGGKKGGLYTPLPGKIKKGVDTSPTKVLTPLLVSVIQQPTFNPPPFFIWFKGGVKHNQAKFCPNPVHSTVPSIHRSSIFIDLYVS